MARSTPRKIGELVKLTIVLTLFLSVCVLCGCTSEQPGSDTPPQTEFDAAAPQAQDVPQFELPEDLSSTLPESDRPTDLDSFKAEFQRRFEQDMYTPFIDLAYWGEATDDQKREYLEGVKATFTMPTQKDRATLHSPDDITIQTLAEYGDWAYFPSEGDDSITLAPPATHVMGIAGHFNESVGVTNYFAIGEKDGKYYFSTIVPQ